MISSTIYNKTARVNIWNANKLHEPVGRVQFVVIEKLTNADLSRITSKKSCDYLLIIYYPNMTLFSSLNVFFRVMAPWQSFFSCRDSPGNQIIFIFLYSVLTFCPQSQLCAFFGINWLVLNQWALWNVGMYIIKNEIL